ncbi:MAG: NADH-quinone oxidoreductase subunit, partial [Campylobacterota bacterium]|nr:NADH-quinone oxidoreductase subunit [Campylobacterota bacterium]
MINFTINGKAVSAQKGETILTVARREGIYIPTMCYLTKIAPIASCRMCIVEVKGANGFVLSCKTPPTEGISVTTDSPGLYKERQNILKLYDVNHPLECGVCDKSGECDLQNKTLEFQVTRQNFSAKDQKRDIQKWNFIQYDPSLCIMCEKCVSTCNQIIGDDAIEVKAGGYSSMIVPKNSDTLDCTFCGECIAVCPVGAMISRDFKYSANAWELNKIPSSCAHCSSTCSLEYEAKYSAQTKKEEIYRVKNDFEFSTLCGAGRFGFDFENNSLKDKQKFNNAVEAFKKAQTILFDSTITNEEARILQLLKEKNGYKLVNKDAYSYKDFLNNFSSMSGGSLYQADLKTVEESDFVIVFGTRIKSDNPMLRYSLTKSVKKLRSSVIYMHPIEDHDLWNVVNQFVKYEVESEEGVLALIAKYFIDKQSMPEKLQAFLDDLDDGYISAESNVGEEEIELMVKKSIRKKNFTLILGEDLINHPRSKNIAKLAGMIEKYSNFKVLIVPPKTNTLGVSLICDLDNEASGYTIGYNTKGDFTLTALGAKGENELDMPALNQQEGTFTNIDKRVVPINAALGYEGYTLCDIANELGIKAQYTIDYTKQLPKEKGYKEVDFDSLENHYTKSGEEKRGYLLETSQIIPSDEIEEIADIAEYNGTVVYRCNPVLQFNQFTA